MAEFCDNDELKLADGLLSNYTILEEGATAVSGSWTYFSDRDEFCWSPGMYKLFGIEEHTKVRPDIYLDYTADETKHIAKRIVNAIYEGYNFDEHLQIRSNDAIKSLRVIGVARTISGSRQVQGIDIDFTDQLNDGHPGPKGPSYEQLRKSDKAKTTFFNNLNSEFQNPMSLVIESINKVIRKVGPDLPDSVIKELQYAQRNAVRMDRLVKSLHDFTHLEQRKERARFLPTDICKLTNEIAATFRTVIEKAGLEFKVHCEKINERIYVDQAIFETVLMNLLSNAFKFTFEGRITVSVSSSRKHVKIVVADTGNGINPVIQKKIFHRFTKFETSSARSLEGMGIGLPLVKELVEFHGGNVTVNSHPGKGSEFIVSLPKGVEHIPPGHVATTGPTDRGSSLRRTVGEIALWPGRDVVPGQNTEDRRLVPTVVIAESDKEMRDYIARSLEEKYKILEADNGKQVLDLIASGFLPDLILADVAMPKMTGFELLASIRNSPIIATVPVILLTARTIADEGIQSLYFGADDYLVKPFSSRELLARVEARIENAIARRKPMQSLTRANTALEERVHHYMKELEHSNKELNEKNSKLMAMNEELTGLTFVASHDLREPLRKIRLFIGRLVKEEQDNLSGNSVRYFQRILSFVQTMGDLVNDITLYTNFNSVGSTSSINLNVMLSSLADFLNPILKEKEATIKIDVEEGIKGNYDQVKQAIYNLISNALKFSKKDSRLEINVVGRIVLGASIDNERCDPTARYYKLSVIDNGIGIEAGYFKQIFDLFKKLHERSVYPGTGIGLTIVRKIMANHNGFVIVESTPNEGSTFSCFFPIEGLS